MKLIRAVSAAVAGLTAAALVTGCSSASSKPAGGGSQAAGGKADLTFWSWVPNMDKVVDAWNASHPDVHVTFSKQAGGDSEAQKVLTAAKANAMPDVIQAEYQEIPTMVSNNVLADISGQANAVQGKFAPAIWNQVTLGSGAVYGVPQDTAPMLLFYRKSLFAKYGLSVPKTWDDYAKLAAEVKQKAPNSYLANFPSVDPGEFGGLAQQAGAKWWSASGTTWGVGINDAPTKKVAAFWDGLLKAGQIDPENAWTPAWNKAMDDGTILSWTAGVWGPGTLEGVAADTKDDWGVAPLPQWDAGSNVTGDWGGSSMAVTTDSKHKDAAAQFVVWMNTDPAALNLLVSQGGIYPADTDAQAGIAAPTFLPSATDFASVAKAAAASAATATWGPDVSTAYSAYDDVIGKTLTNKTALPDAFDTIQQTVLADMKKNGFTVSGS
ncbi:ABC transporter substrate-binding protein [Catenulispora rubra]|uniref:ABC transporter substrate-binding protein n=1 Tax=Catenulispora rubra TaxID=280293 RepID=UPI0018923800|nr:extracellular solute-binding protein [Catenulispora rubra]